MTGAQIGAIAANERVARLETVVEALMARVRDLETALTTLAERTSAATDPQPGGVTVPDWLSREEP